MPNGDRVGLLRDWMLREDLMTFPLSGADPGETEFGHGKGLLPSARQIEQRNENSEQVWPYDKAPDGPFGRSVNDIAAAIRRTDPADPNAVADYAAAPNTINNKTQTQWVRES